MDICYKRYLIKENGRLIKFMEDGYNINLKKNHKWKKYSRISEFQLVGLQLYTFNWIYHQLVEQTKFG